MFIFVDFDIVYLVNTSKQFKQVYFEVIKSKLPTRLIRNVSIEMYQSKMKKKERQKGKNAMEVKWRMGEIKKKYA